MTARLSRGARLGCASLLLCQALLFSTRAAAAPSADPREGPGVYGELNGVLALGLSAGAALPALGSGSGSSPLVQGALDLFVLGSAGLKLGYGGLWRGLGGGYDVRNHALTTTLEVRPLFLYMFLTDRFSGRETRDLILYSLGLELGFSYERASVDGGGPASQQDAAFGFHVGVGFEVPLWRTGVHGLFLRFGVRGNFVRELTLAPALQAASGRVAHTFDALQVGLWLRYRFQFWERP